MAASLRQTTACIGIVETNQPISMMLHFFGYMSSSPPAPLSMATQVDRLQGPHVHLNIIRVGAEQFDDADNQEIDRAIRFARDTLETAGLGVGRISHLEIADANANGHDVIDSDAESQQLTEEVTINNPDGSANDALDVFFVPSYVGGVCGFSAIEGTCDKRRVGELTGLVVEMNSGGGVSDFTLAHEIGHYLGLDHVGASTDPANSPNRQRLMFPNVPNGGQIDSTEAVDLIDHCFTKPAC